jgi:hypothetical protein
MGLTDPSVIETPRAEHQQQCSEAPAQLKASLATSARPQIPGSPPMFFAVILRHFLRLDRPLTRTDSGGDQISERPLGPLPFVFVHI